jgi:hypothetical protein
MEYIAQLIASHRRADAGLGPASAKNSVDKLFDDTPYSYLRKLDPDLVYQLYLLDQRLDEARSVLGKKPSHRRLVKTIGRHSELTAFALVSRVIETTGAWGTEPLTAWLEKAPNLERLARLVLISLYSDYKSQARDYKKAKQKELTPNNYFKSGKYVDPVLSAELPPEWVAEGKRYGLALKRAA